VVKLSISINFKEASIEREIPINPVIPREVESATNPAVENRAITGV